MPSFSRPPGPFSIGGARRIAPAPRGEIVDFAVLQRELLQPGGDLAARSYRAWLSKAAKDAAYKDVQEFVHMHTHSVLHRLTPADVARVASDPDPSVRTGHAIGDIRNKEAGVIQTSDFSSPWAFQYLLHGLLETLGRVPRFEDFDAYLRGPARERYYDRFTKKFGYERRSAGEIESLERGFQYRVGNAYYSFLREVDLMTRLRAEHGLRIRYHVLADVQFRVDFWCGPVLVALWVRNPRYRDGSGGRKQSPDEHLDLSAFHLLPIELDRPDQRDANRPVLFSPKQIEAAARSIQGSFLKDAA